MANLMMTDDYKVTFGKPNKRRTATGLIDRTLTACGLANQAKRRRITIEDLDRRGL